MEAVKKLAFTGWGREVVALGYQFGYLMLPIIAASSLWIALNRPLLDALLAEQDAAEPPPDSDEK